jgi:hypothetical protein
MEKLCGSIGLSLIILYLVTGLVFVVGAGTGERIPGATLAATSVLAVVLGIVARRDVLRLLQSFRVKYSLLGYGFLLVWALLLLGMIRVYSGADWYGDWLEHFQRTLFFLHRFPADTRIGNPAHIYLLPARPPLMNVVAAYFLGQTEDRFELFQIAFTFLNLLVFLPCCLILPAIAGPRRISILALVALFALSPVIMQSATYSWTKGLAAFYVVLGLAFYLGAWRKRDQLRMVAAFVSLAAGSLVHYSTGPYAVFLALHYVLRLFWKRPNKWGEAATILNVSSILLLTWFAWSVKTYGKATFLSNTTVTSSQSYEGSNVAKALANTYDSIVPAVLRDRSLLDKLEQPNPVGRLRDNAFVFYQTNMIFGMGLVGGPAVLYLLWPRFHRRPREHKDEWCFWLSLVLFCATVGIGVVGGRDELGVAHATLLSLEILGLTLLASAMPQSRILTFAVIVGCLLDFSLGIFLHAHVQGMENDSGKIIFSEVEFADSTIGVAKPGPDGLSSQAWNNWLGKHSSALYERWLRELPERNGNDKAFQAGWPAFRDQLQHNLDENATQWGGWYARHNGEVEYVGDHIAGRFGERIPASILLCLLAGLIAVLIKNTPAVSAVPLTKRSASPGERPTRGKRAPPKGRV